MLPLKPIRLLLIGGAAVGVLAWAASFQIPAIGAGALLFPSKRALRTAVPAGCVERTFAGDGVKLAGWYCAARQQPAHTTIVYLHGIADNRSGAAGIVERFVPRGFEVVAYDSRAHGASEGAHCTYGFYEKQDLQHVLAELGATRVIAIGHSLGAAVALQAAAIEPRIQAVVAAATFSDLRTIATERAPFFFTKGSIAGAFTRAEQGANFRVDDASPLIAAAAITVPVLLFHGANDHNTAPSHSRRVFDALRGPKKLVVVPGAGHIDVLNGDAWSQIDTWLRENVRTGG